MEQILSYNRKNCKAENNQTSGTQQAVRPRPWKEVRLRQPLDGVIIITLRRCAVSLHSPCGCNSRVFPTAPLLPAWRTLGLHAMARAARTVRIRAGGVGRERGVCFFFTGEGASRLSKHNESP
jgi:hypothetical protein